MTVVALAEASDAGRFGGKAAALANAIAAGLPVPGGFAIDFETVDRIAAGDATAAAEITAAFDELRTTNPHERGSHVAARSSAIGEDSRDASFAGQHATILNVTSAGALLEAVRRVHASAHDSSVLEYRRRMGIEGAPRIAVVVQRMVAADVAGVLFTRNPMTGAAERVIEASWGLGEAVVSGLVTPDRFRVAADGEILERVAGRKDFVIRFDARGGTVEEPVSGDDVTRLCLSDEQLGALHRLATECERHFGGPQDLEWAFSGGELFLLQTRPITTMPATEAAAAPQETNEEAHEPLTTRTFIGLALAALLAPLNSTIIAVALPSVSQAFDTNAAVVTRWLVTAYLVVSIVAQSPAGKLADRWGYSRVLTLGRAMFGAGALLAAFSPALPILGAGRVLMALGGAFSIPTVFAQLRNSVPHERRGRVFGIFGAIMGSAAAAGPLLGGVLTSRYGWHSVFFVNVPVVLLSLLLEPPRRRPTETRAARSPFDVAGSVLLGIAVLLLVGAVERSSLLLATGAIATAAAFVLYELRIADPVLDVRLFQRRAFAAGSAIVALQNLAMYSILFLLPFFLSARGLAAAATGQMLLVFTAGMVLFSPIGGRLSDRVGARAVAFLGAMIATGGAALFVAGGELLAALVAMGVGIGLGTSPSQAAALGAVTRSEAGVASGALSTMRYVGGVAGSGLVAMLAANGIGNDPRLLVFPAVLLASAAISMLLPGPVRQ